jgi:hypothetical protein
MDAMVDVTNDFGVSVLQVGQQASASLPLHQYTTLAFCLASNHSLFARFSPLLLLLVQDETLFKR